jgi:hypothetical protein
MSFRGGLRQCATQAFHAMQLNGQPECSILRSKTGKYYTLIFPPDYDRYHDKVKSGDLTLALCMTQRELYNLINHPQTDFIRQLEIPKGKDDFE